MLVEFFHWDDWGYSVYAAESDTWKHHCSPEGHPISSWKLCWLREGSHPFCSERRLCKIRTPQAQWTQVGACRAQGMSRASPCLCRCCNHLVVDNVIHPCKFVLDLFKFKPFPRLMITITKALLCQKSTGFCKSETPDLRRRNVHLTFTWIMAL